MAVANKPAPFAKERDGSFPSPGVRMMSPNHQIRLLAVIIFDIYEVNAELIFLRGATDAKDAVPHLGKREYVDPGVMVHGSLQRGRLKALRHGGVVQPVRAMIYEGRERILGAK